jgi:hypothetical protein
VIDMLLDRFLALAEAQGVQAVPHIFLDTDNANASDIAAVICKVCRELPASLLLVSHSSGKVGPAGECLGLPLIGGLVGSRQRRYCTSPQQAIIRLVFSAIKYQQPSNLQVFVIIVQNTAAWHRAQRAFNVGQCMFMW